MRTAPFVASLGIALRLGLSMTPVALVPLVVAATATEAAADAKGQARTHYQAGVKFYSQGDYKAAIREFSAAQQIYPADLNNYNLALCYDKLGDPEPAIQYYRAYLDKQPNSDKRGEIEASISRLEAAQARVNAKKEAEAKKIEAARKAAEEKRLAEEAKAAEAAAKRAAAEQKKLDEQRRIEEEKARREEAKRRPPTEDKIPADNIGDGGGAPIGPAPVGSTGTPGSGTTVSTGDAQLDRVSSIDINQIRDQRVGGAGGAMPDNGVGANGAAGVNGAGADPAVAGQGSSTTQGGVAPTPGVPDPSDKPKATPVYKKWWFWVIVGVGAYVLYQVASEPDDETTATSRMSPLMAPMATGGAPSGGGLTLMRW